SERRIGVVRPVAKPPGQALTDFEIFRRIAEAWGCAGMFDRWRTPEQVFQVLKELSAGQPCDLTGIRDYAQLEESGGIQWPFPAGATETARERRLFSDGRFFHPDGKARLVAGEPTPLPEPADKRFPFTL